jgi:hypothetical protein
MCNKLIAQIFCYAQLKLFLTLIVLYSMENKIPEGGKELIGYNVEYWVRWSKGVFLAKGVIVNYRKQSKNGKLSYSGGVYSIRCGKKIYAKRRGEFNVIAK